jgi:tartrate-resistant acid phosphatase type 5
MALTYLILVVVLGLVIWFAYARVPHPHYGKEMVREPRQADRVTLLMVGDVGSGLPFQRDVAALMEDLAGRHAIDALILAGDNFINHGVESTSDPLWHERFHDVYKSEHLKNLPVFAVLGNHDYCGNPQVQIDYSAICSGRWNMPARHYSVRFGELLQLGMIDTNFPDWCGLGLLPLDFVEKKLRKSKVSWRVVVGHRPLYSGGIYKSLQIHLRLLLSAFLLRSRAVVYFSGHEHCQQHIQFRPFFSSKTLHQIVSGSGGSELREVGSLAGMTQFAAMQHGVVLAEFSKGSAVFSFFAVGSKDASYSFSLEHA